MSKEFKQGNTYVFTTKNYRKCFPKSARQDWANRCNGREVTIRTRNDATIGMYGISPRWCKCIKVGTK